MTTEQVIMLITIISPSFKYNPNLMFPNYQTNTPLENSNSRNYIFIPVTIQKYLRNNLCLFVILNYDLFTKCIRNKVLTLNNNKICVCLFVCLFK